ncbi:DUF4118 domain-containing protein [Anaerofilum sp. BX8]|uniref:DUF4118 domain-containing protein n=1 Tax=Anaerofilum hominis TaxID=2763016 RepID=A0A923I6B7_9FIRM|nr:DUF4118 domain-containing protein [Anaerofilum hominis]MBC5581110.1 DUF4118 domain-containing protein [Anaerofilum hominis]
MKEKRTVRCGALNYGKAAAALALCTLLALALQQLGAHTENCLMIYLLGTIIIILETGGYLFGMGFAAVCMLVFNFLFTDPRLSFKVSDPNLLLTMGIFLVVSLLTAVLVTRLQQQERLARDLARRTQALFEISSGYLNLSGVDNIVYYGLRSLYSARGDRCVAYVASPSAGLSKPYYIAAQFDDPADLEGEALPGWCLVNATPCGAGTAFYGESHWLYLPIRSSGRVLGVLGVFCGGGQAGDEQMLFVRTVLSQMGLALERELGSGEKAKNSDVSSAGAPA